MSREECEIKLATGCLALFCPFLILCLVFFSTALSERRKLDTYVQTDSLVTNSFLKKCGVTRTKQGDKQCFRLEWQIKYLQYQNDKQASITRSENYLKSETHMEDELQIEFMKHQVCMF